MSKQVYIDCLDIIFLYTFLAFLSENFGCLSWIGVTLNSEQ